MISASNKKYSMFTRTLAAIVVMVILSVSCVEANEMKWSSNKSSEPSAWKWMNGKIYGECRHSPKKAQWKMIGLGVIALCALLTPPALLATVNLPGCYMLPAFIGLTVIGGFAGGFCLQYRRKLDMVRKLEENPRLSKNELDRKNLDLTKTLAVCLGFLCFLSIISISFVGEQKIPYLLIASSVFATLFVARPIFVAFKYGGIKKAFESARPEGVQKPKSAEPIRVHHNTAGSVKVPKSADKPALKPAPSSKNQQRSKQVVRQPTQALCEDLWTAGAGKKLESLDDHEVLTETIRTTTMNYQFSNYKDATVTKSRRRMATGTMEHLSNLIKANESL